MLVPSTILPRLVRQRVAVKESRVVVQGSSESWKMSWSRPTSSGLSGKSHTKKLGTHHRVINSRMPKSIRARSSRHVFIWRHPRVRCRWIDVIKCYQVDSCIIGIRWGRIPPYSSNINKECCVVKVKGGVMDKADPKVNSSPSHKASLLANYQACRHIILPASASYAGCYHK